MNKDIIVIHHSADFDGLFCREIARKFLGEAAEYIGWDFADAPLAIPDAKTIYILDLPVDRIFGLKFGQDVPVPSDNFAPFLKSVIWIDHHKSSIESHPKDIRGYRVDGVAACRLAWQWFANPEGNHQLPAHKHAYVERLVCEPYAVRLAGEYDIWDKRDPNADVFQFGLRSVEAENLSWARLLSGELIHCAYVDLLLSNGRLLQRYQQQNDAGVVNFRSFLVEFEGLKFLALNTARCNSLTFAAKDVPETGHDGLMAFYWNGAAWNVSLYHAKHRTELDLSAIAVKFGGGGHRGACGFRVRYLPFFTDPRSLPQSIDAQVWAKDWLKTIQVNPAIPTDEGTMITWFAGAIMAGYDEARRKL